MSLLRIYTRALELLGKESRLAWILAVANLILAAAQLAEPILFGRIVDVLSGTPPAGIWATVALSVWGLLAAWAAFGLFTIVCGGVVALNADKLAHRQRQAVLTNYFEHIMQLPLTFHTGTHSGRLMKVMLNGTDSLWRLWVGFFREYFAAIVSLIVLLPLALYINWRLAALLFVLSVIFTVLTTLVVRKTYGMQSEVETHYGDLSARASDALGNVALVQSFVRIDSEVQGLRFIADKLLARQMPVLSWWALVNVVTRASTTITVLAIFAVGIVLHERGLTTVGEIVMFVSFATMLIQKLEQVVGFINSVFMEAPRLQEFFAVLDQVPAVRDRPDAIDPGRLSGLVEFRDVSFSYDGKRPAVEDLSFTVLPGQTIALVGSDRRRKIHRDCTPASRVRPAIRLHPRRRHGRSRPDAVGVAAKHRRGVSGSAAVQPLDRGQSARRQARRHRRRNARLRRRARRRSNSSSAASRNSTPMPASADECCPAASGSGCRLRVRC